MYQNLRTLIDPESTKGEDTNSVHYLLLPSPKYDALFVRLVSSCGHVGWTEIVMQINVIPVRTALLRESSLGNAVQAIRRFVISLFCLLS